MGLTSARRATVWFFSVAVVAGGSACSSAANEDPAIVTVVPAAGGASGAGGVTHAGGATAGAGGGTSGGAGEQAGPGGAGHAGGGTAGSGAGHAGQATGGSTAAGTGGAPAGAGGMPVGPGGAPTQGAGGAPAMGAGGAPAMGAGGAPTMGAGGMPNNGCDSLKFPSVELVTVPAADITAEYDALGVTGCESPKCFLDVTDLKSPDGTAHDIHVAVSPNFQLYELVGTDVDPNGTGNVDPGAAYSTRVLLSVNLVEHLQKLREIQGGPVNITSGFRSPAHQHAICQSICGANQCTDGSGAVTCARNSRHMWGAAADMSLTYESAANAAGFAFVYHENGGTAPHLHVDMQACQ